jgi:hypothetical protein
LGAAGFNGLRSNKGKMECVLGLRDDLRFQGNKMVPSQARNMSVERPMMPIIAMAA